jgi:sporadic carbohydrate cluster 2OG-Fe(II) oxygenase
VTPPSPSFAFLDEDERRLGESFLDRGYAIVPAEDRQALDALQCHLAESAAQHLGLTVGDDTTGFLDTIHTHVTPARLNALRLACITRLNAAPWARAAYFRLARRAIEALVGNELAMQLRLNLSIQLPQDESSLLPLHADVWNGDSPYEVVAWVPLVDCHATKSMFILPAAANSAWEPRMARFRTTEDLYQAVSPELEFLPVRFGEVLVFSQNLMHGNRVNEEDSTRWSMNCRFKSVLSPYADKRLGEFFEPVTLKPATRLGNEYRLPEGFHE